MYGTTAVVNLKVSIALSEILQDGSFYSARSACLRINRQQRPKRRLPSLSLGVGCALPRVVWRSTLAMATRSITVQPQGTGQPCPALEDNSYTCNPRPCPGTVSASKQASNTEILQLRAASHDPQHNTHVDDDADDPFTMETRNDSLAMLLPREDNDARLSDLLMFTCKQPSWSAIGRVASSLASSCRLAGNTQVDQRHPDCCPGAWYLQLNWL